MAKKARKRRKQTRPAIPRQAPIPKRGRKVRKALAVIGVCLALIGGGITTLGGFRKSAITVRTWLGAAPMPTPDPFAASNPAKEYIYAGGRLVATEEPAPVAPPSSLVATGVSIAQVNVSWTAAPGTIDHYQVERTSNINTSYSVVAPTVTGLSFPDTSVTSGNAYLYRVCAVDGAGHHSTYTNLDVATAITFADDPLVLSTTLIKAQHIYDLRQAVNAVRATAGLSAATWTDGSLSGVTILAIHFEELRTQLDPALNALGLPAGSWTDASLSGKTIKKLYVDEIRDRVR